jgi:zinc transport system permease protein
MDLVYDFIRNGLQVLVQKGALPDEFKYGFVINSLLCACLVGPVLGALGTIVIVKRLAFFSSAVGNAAITGIALGILFGEPVSAPYVSLISFALLFALLLNFVRTKTDMPQDALIAVFLAASLAAGSALMFSVTRTINIHILDSFLFGSILTTSYSDITLLLVTGGLAVIACGFYFNRLLLSGLDPVLAGVRGVRVTVANYLFVIIVALVTVASIKTVGAILVEALLIIPAAASRNISSSLKSFVLWSVIFGTVSAVAGIVLPVHFDISIPSGAAIIICATGIFVITLVIRMFRVRQTV